jgi:hypothetical protein
MDREEELLRHFHVAAGNLEVVVLKPALVENVLCNRMGELLVDTLSVIIKSVPGTLAEEVKAVCGRSEQEQSSPSG